MPQLLGALEESFEGPLPIRRADGSESQAYRYGVGYAWPATHQHAEIPYSIYILEDAQALWQHADAKVFEAWAREERKSVLVAQKDDGSWHDPQFGDAFATAMNCLFLEIPLGLLPIFQR